VHGSFDQASMAGRLLRQVALWWLGATQDSISARERAYAGFRRAQDQAHAADVALTLSVHYRANVGNAAASAGWLARAARLINDFGLEDMRGCYC
jgi:hypothetical protein